MMCQCGFIHFNDVPLRWGMLTVGGAYACVGLGDKWEISGPSIQLYSEHKTALK